MRKAGRRSPAKSFAMVRDVGSTLLVLVCASGCIDRARQNPRCEWTRDSAFPLNLTNPDDRKHLIADAQLAEDLAVRYADAAHKQRFGYTGHGGLIDHGRVVHECMATLVAVIERTHGVTAMEIDEARAERNPMFDVPVILSFVAIYMLGAAAAAVWLRRRFRDASRLVRTIVTGGASIAFSALGIQLGAVYTGIWESVRIGNDHLGGFRLGRPPWTQHLEGVFVAGILLFWIVVGLVSRSARDNEWPVDPAGATHTLLG